MRHHPLRALSFLVGDVSMRHVLKARRGAARRRVYRHEPRLYGIGDWAAIAQTVEG